MPLQGSYDGSSFFELLQLEHKHLLPDVSVWSDSAADQVPHGTTVLAMRFGDGVLVAGDRLATAGHSVASRDVVKVFQTDPYSVMAISGAAGPCIEMAKVLSVDMRLNMALPCRISVYTEKGATKIGLIKPAGLLSSLSDDAELSKVAIEVEEKTILMIDNAK